ncbi:MAG: tRNA 2-thiouridine(34) synthase MnmA [Candidatus Moranbacteria bacterium]|nr:tRNA 2-thiouridine(34) synthase MnmA [Candidatus Moranbacteria bacterium]
MKSNQRKILHAISGGVDSITGAFLLKKRNFDVQAVYFIIPQGAQPFQENFFLSQVRARIFTIKKICKRLNIKLDIIDIRKEFNQKIIKHSLEKIKLGQTPNPCVICNKEMKFKKLLEIADKKNINLVSTGHYADKTSLKDLMALEKFKNINLKKVFSKKEMEDFYFIKKGFDSKKDQSYFLSMLNFKHIKSIVFPLAAYKKNQIYEIAYKNNLIEKDLKESKGLCFIKKSFKEFVSANVSPQPGKIVDLNSRKVLGIVDDLSNYTIGQRKNIQVGQSGPYFVIKKDYQKSILYVSNIADEKRLFKDKLLLKVDNFNKLLKIIIDEKMFQLLSVKTRYAQHNEEIKSLELVCSNLLKINLKDKIRAITPGQIGAIYLDRKIVLAAGEIQDI